MRTILFVCTGNTCRSPMAACMLNALAAEEGVCDLQAMSAGVSAEEGAPASVGALRAMARRGLSLESHLSRPVSRKLLEAATLVMCMGQHHVAAIRHRFPGIATPVRAFDDPPISDPFGGDDAAYERAARDIARQLRGLLHN